MTLTYPRAGLGAPKDRQPPPTTELGLPASRCVYVDDLPGNLKPAAALGMATVRHRAAATTIAELERLLGLDLAGRGRPG